MKNAILGLTLILGVTHATTLADVQTLVEKAGYGTGLADSYQLVQQDQRTRSITQRVSRPTVIFNNEPGQSTPITRRPASVASKVQTPDVNAGWVKCPCGEDCKCPTEQVCKNGECKKNYLVMFTAKWCAVCPRMKKVMQHLSAEGYIVHFVDTDENPKQAEAFKITSLPTVIVMDQNKEVRRFVGMTAAEAVKEGVKKKIDQKVETTDYNFLD